MGKIWVVPAAGGTPRRLTADSFEPMEYAPSWSPDGNHIAFTTWEEPAEGHVWRVAVSRGAPQRLSETSGEYIHPVWSPDGNSIVVARGAGGLRSGTARGLGTHGHDLVRIPAQGGPAGVRGEGEHGPRWHGRRGGPASRSCAPPLPKAACTIRRPSPPTAGLLGQRWRP